MFPGSTLSKSTFLLTLAVFFLLQVNNVYTQTKITFLSNISNEKKSEILNDHAYLLLDSNLDSADFYASEANYWAQKFDNYSELGRAQFVLGYSKEIKGNLLDALEYYLKSLNNYYRIGDQPGIASLSSYVGTIYKMLGERSLAVQYFEISLENYIKIRDFEGVAFAQNNLGTVYMQMKLYRKAENHFMKSLVFFNNNNDSTSAASVYINLGIIAFNQKELTTAKNLYLKAADIARTINNADILATAYSNLAEVFNEQGLKKNAINFYHLSLDLGGNEFAVQRNANINLSLAEIYTQLSQNNAAEESFLQAIKIAKNSKMRPILCDAYRKYSEFLYKNKRFEESARYMELFALQNDSLYNSEVLSKVSLSNLRLETIEQENEKKLLQKQNQIAELKLKTNKLLAIIFGALLIIIFLILFITLRKLKSTRTRKEQLAWNLEQAEIKNSELQRIRDLLGKNVSEKSLQLDNEWRLRIQNEKSASKLLQRFKKDILQRERAFLLLKEELNDSIQTIIKKLSKSENDLAEESTPARIQLQNTREQLEQLMTTFSELHTAMNVDGESDEKLMKAVTLKRLISEKPETAGLLYLHPALEDAEFNNNEVAAKLILKKLLEFFHSGFGKIAQIRMVPVDGSASFEVSAFVRNDVFDKLKTLVSPSTRLLQRDQLLNTDFDFLSLLMLESMSYIFRIPLKIFLSGPNEPVVFQWSFSIRQNGKLITETKDEIRFLVLESDEKITSVLLNKQLSSFGKVKLVKDTDFINESFVVEDFDYFFVDFTFNEKAEVIEKLIYVLSSEQRMKSAAVIAYASPNEEDRLRQMGFDYILEKPIILQKIKDIIKG